MKVYRVFGDRLTEYYIDVEAESLEEAYDKANGSESHKWNAISSDETIEAYDCEELVIANVLHEYRGQTVDL